MVLYMNGPSEKAEIAITISFRPNGPRSAAIRHAAEALRRTAGFVLPVTKKTDQAHLNGGFVVTPASISNLVLFNIIAILSELLETWVKKLLREAIFR